MLQCEPLNVNPGAFVSSLPVAAVLPELLSALQHAPQVLLNAPTGAGKSTWLPLQILAESNIAGRIILLEPRRLAARNVAQRLAELLGEKPGRPWVSACAPKPASDRRPAWRWLRRILTRMISAIRADGRGAGDPR